MGSVTSGEGYLSLTPEQQESNSSSSSVLPLYKVGRVLYRYPVPAWSSYFSTTFTVRISAFANTTGSGDGMAFVFAQDSSPSPPDSYGSFLGLLDRSTEVFETVQKSGGVIKQLGIELDTFMNQEFDPDDNHIAIDTTSIMDPVAIQSLTSSGINLKSGRDIKFSIEYDGWNQILHVSAGYSENPLVTILNHSISMFDSTVPSFVYVGFTASTGTLPESHQVRDWVFTSLKLPNPSPPGNDKVHKRKTRNIWLVDVPVFLCVLVLIAFTYPLIMRVVKRNHCGGNEREDIESRTRKAVNAPKMFSYKEISRATQNFSKENLIGAGAFGVVYKGIIPDDIDVPPKTIAVKRITATSKQGENRCLIYEFMPNGSLDRYIGKGILDWKTRYNILTGLASALLYLHEECGTPVVHRDIKPNNVMLDSDYNAHLGDFGLARLMLQDPEFTIPLAGTPGYLAPEVLGFAGKATPESDVYSFGMVVLEVVCGRRSKGIFDDYSLVENVWNLYAKDELLECVDQVVFDGKFEEEQVKRTLIVGLACLHTDFTLRPKIRKVVQILMNPNEPLLDLPDTRPRPSAVYLSVSSSAPRTTNFDSATMMI
uniref:probable L-type lectin-domain containing receptor kinase S.5 n=1 Tax=Fragaria vesca subsp. vesca TaxID=101020 RepID=UPI0005C91161|nr:PREDICTED: probable L-type lectin-domain containing receptor kinase S.5 [Fragaria vesca subsp. vesca]